jgi:hypothetical protein
MRLNEHRTVIIILGASSALFAQNLSNAPEVRQIVELSTEATQRHWQERLHYTYMSREERRRRDRHGRVKSEDVDVSRTILVNGVPFEQLVEHNGRPPSAEEERKQKEDIDKLPEWYRLFNSKELAVLSHSVKLNLCVPLSPCVITTWRIAWNSRDFLLPAPNR